MNKTIHENEFYAVAAVESGVIPGDTKDLPCYALINLETNITEGEFFFMPQALVYADQLADNIREFREGEPADLVTEDVPKIAVPH